MSNLIRNLAKLGNIHVLQTIMRKRLFHQRKIESFHRVRLDADIFGGERVGK
jgi:hypothetical protein